LLVGAAAGSYFSQPDIYTDCHERPMVLAMERYGKIFAVYSTPIFRDQDPGRAWSATFESRDTTLKVEFKAYGHSMCEAVNALYDKWSEIPFQRIGQPE
jgi:hypothetical protein